MLCTTNGGPLEHCGRQQVNHKLRESNGITDGCGNAARFTPHKCEVARAKNLEATTDSLFPSVGGVGNPFELQVERNRAACWETCSEKATSVPPLALQLGQANPSDGS